MKNEADNEVRPVEEVWSDFDVRATVAALCDGEVGLDDLDWSRIRHGYGHAGAVPLLLKRIAGADAAFAAAAMETLWGIGFVEGVTTVPGALAVPFLLRASADPAVHQRDVLLRFAASAARCEKWFREGRAELLQVIDTVAPQVRYDVTGYVATWSVSAARHAVGAHLGPLISLLDDADPRTRCHAAYTLAAALPAGDTVPRALEARIPVETDPAAQISLVLAVAQHSRELAPSESALNRARDLWSNPEKPAAIRMAGAIAWLCSTSAPPPSMLTQTVTALTGPAVFDALRGVPWVDHLRPDQLPIWLAALIGDPAGDSAPQRLWPRPSYDTHSALT